MIENMELVEEYWPNDENISGKEDPVMQNLISNLEFLLKREYNKDYLKLCPILNNNCYLMWRTCHKERIVIQDAEGYFTKLNIVKDIDNSKIFRIPFLLNEKEFEEMVHLSGKTEKAELGEKRYISKQETDFFKLSLKLFKTNVHSYVKFVENFNPKKRLIFSRIIERRQNNGYILSIEEQQNYNGISFRYKYSKNPDDTEHTILSKLKSWEDHLFGEIHGNYFFERLDQLKSEYEDHIIGKHLLMLLECDLNYDNYQYKVFGLKSKSANF